MTKHQIIEWAKESMCYANLDSLSRFAALVAAHLNGAADEIRSWPLEVHPAEKQESFSPDVPEMAPIGGRKLQDLLAQGWVVDGVSISRQREDEPARGLVTAGGMVCWWISNAAMDAYAAKAVEHDRKRIKDGIMALVMTAPKLNTPDANDARMSLALRISMMLDGHTDLVMNDAGRLLMEQLQEETVSAKDGLRT